MANAAVGIRFHGLKELQRALKRFGSGVAKEIDVELKDAGKLVVDEARNRFQLIDATETLRVGARTPGFGRLTVARTRTRNRRGDFGALIMRRALLPARADAGDRLLERLDHMLGRLGGEEGF